MRSHCRLTAAIVLASLFFSIPKPSLSQDKHTLDTAKIAEVLRSNGGLGSMPYHYMSSLDNIVMSAPDAARMTRYADTPVSYALGLPEISIPIHTVQSRSLCLPITLTYDASGVKPSEISGVVGLGWSLQAGGVITREIVGWDDDDIIRLNLSNDGFIL